MADGESGPEAGLIAWIERRLAGRVTAIERQARWRPAWYVTVETADGTLPIYVRGRRDQSELLFFPLAHEAEIFRVLHAAGIPSPRIYGLTEQPQTIVMDQMPGRPNLATADTPEEAHDVLMDFVDVLVRMHAIPAERFAGAGLDIPGDAAALHFGLFDRFEEIQLANQRRPEPEVAFVKRWLRRNLPAHRTKPSFITCDSGQFLFDRGKVTSVLDMELAHIGDPALDLASLLLRDLSEPLGDLAPAFARYEALSGEPIDWDVVRYYIALWGIMTPMVTGHLAKDPTPELSFMYNMDQVVMLTRIPLEAIADLIGVDLEPLPLPFERDGAGSTVATRAAIFGLFGALADLKPTESYESYRHQVARDVTEYLDILIGNEGATLAADRDEAHALLGHDIADETERDAALEALALSAGPERDGELVRFFHKRIARREALLGPNPKLFVRRTLQPIPQRPVDAAA